MYLQTKAHFARTTDFENGDLPFCKAFAHALEWLYDEDKFVDERSWLYCMNGVMPVFALMSIVTDIICFSFDEYAELNIKDYIQRMQEGNDIHRWDENKPYLKYEGEYIILGQVHHFTTEVILWAAYLYLVFRSELKKDDENIERAKSVIYKLYSKCTGLKEEYIKETFLMKHFNHTMVTFAEHASKRSSMVNEEGNHNGHKNKEMEQSVLDKIPANNLCYYYEGWRNGKKGGFVQKHGIYRFQEQQRNKGGILDRVSSKDEDDPVVAVGIVAYWLMFNSRMNIVLKRLTLYKNGIPQDIREQFDNYTRERFNQFRELNRDNPDTSEWNWDYEFYSKYIIPHEIKLNKQSEALFDYISDADIELVRKVMNNYIKYLKRVRKKKGYDVKPELLVLRSIDSMDDTKMEDLEDFEVRTILDKLEKMGCVKVAWIEGHRPEAVRLLDKGRVYLKHLEKRSVAKGTKPVIHQFTWEEEKECFKSAVLHIMEKKRANGGYLFEKPTQWMAVYRLAVDISVMYDINDPSEPEDPSNPQYKRFHDFAHELHLDVNPPTRLPFTKKAINSINSNKSYVRYNTRYPWPKDEINDPRSFDFYAEMEDVYLALKEEYNNLESVKQKEL